MKTLRDLKPGDEVWVCYSNRKPYVAYVERVGSKILHVGGKSDWNKMQFRLDTGNLNDKNFGQQTYVYTSEQYQELLVRNERDRYLGALGLYNRNFRRAHGITWTEDQKTALYNFLKTLEPNDA
jgi:hypothetical protein